MSVLRALRLLILGETWTLPLGVLLVLSLGAALESAVPRLWHDAGGPVLLVGILGVLGASLSPRRRRR